MKASVAKKMTDENFNNKRNGILRNIFIEIRKSISLGDYYCEYEFTDECSVHDYEHVVNQLTSLGYKIIKIHENVEIGRFNSSAFIYRKVNYEIKIEWGN